MAALPSLISLRMTSPPQPARSSSAFLECLSAGRLGRQLRHLDISAISTKWEHVRALQRMVGLESLAVTTSNTSDLAGLSTLPQLRELSIYAESRVQSPPDVTWLGALRLHSLTMLDVPEQAVLEALPSSLKRLQFNLARVQDLKRVFELARSASWLPGLQSVHVTHLKVVDRLIPGGCSWLAARPSLHFTCCEVQVWPITDEDDFWHITRACDENAWEGFLEACQQAPPSFASSIQDLSIRGRVPPGVCSALALNCPNVKGGWSVHKSKVLKRPASKFL